MMAQKNSNSYLVCIFSTDRRAFDPREDIQKICLETALAKINEWQKIAKEKKLEYTISENW